MSEDTRDIAIEARTDIRQIKDMLRSHIEETRDHREGLKHDLSENIAVLKVEISGIKQKQGEHNDLIQQLKGAKFTVSAIAATATTIGIGGMAKIFGLIR